MFDDIARTNARLAIADIGKPATYRNSDNQEIATVVFVNDEDVPYESPDRLLATERQSVAHLLVEDVGSPKRGDAIVTTERTYTVGGRIRGDAYVSIVLVHPVEGS